VVDTPSVPTNTPTIYNGDGSCEDLPALYTTPDGVQFEKQCGYIHCYYRSYYIPTQPTFKDCLDQCALMNNCVGVDYVGTPYFQCIAMGSIAGCGLGENGEPEVYDIGNTALRLDPPPQIPDPPEEG
jgi:hypothetical protein